MVIHEVFRVVWGGVAAGVVDQSEPGLGLGRGELVDGARRSVRAGRSRVTTAREHDVVAGAVRQACVTQDAVFLASLLAPDATAFFDGGGKVRALAEPVHGNEQVTRALLALLARGPRTFLDTRSVNGRTGLVVRYDRTVAAVISLDTAGHHVVQVWATLNPDELRPWNRPGTTPGPPRPKTT
ncbi:hypothetical protein ABZ611_21795 [Streptomyces sp. NPDC007861]|uniref:hypothetical protein n=1 Tax=Streptomyces sp. NPDC007861 TaxID=3154893 RepID=UPI00340894C3